MTIHKYPLSPVSTQTIELPAGATILTVQMQRNTPTLWALVDPAAAKVHRTFAIYGTGYSIEGEPGAYIGTVQDEAGFVWHVFEK